MYTARKVSRKDFMGFSWFKVYKNEAHTGVRKFTGNSYNALDSEHAIKMHKQLRR